jgi:hypothetical protein
LHAVEGVGVRESARELGVWRGTKDPDNIIALSDEDTKGLKREAFSEATRPMSDPDHVDLHSEMLRLF